MGWSKIGAIEVHTQFNATTHATPVTASLSGLTLAVGDLLVVSVFWGNSDIHASITLTDNAGTPNTYYAHPAPLYDVTDASGATVLWAPILNVTSLTTLSLSWTGGTSINFIGWVIEQFRHTAGALTAGNPVSGTPASQDQAVPTTGTDAVSSTTTTPSVNGCLIHGRVALPAGVPTTTSHGTGFTLGTDATATSNQETEWLEQATAGAKAATFTLGGTSEHTQTFVVALAPPSGASGSLFRGNVDLDGLGRIGAKRFNPTL